MGRKWTSVWIVNGRGRSEIVWGQRTGVRDTLLRRNVDGL